MSWDHDNRTGLARMRPMAGMTIGQLADCVESAGNSAVDTGGEGPRPGSPADRFLSDMRFIADQLRETIG